ncbi:MAG: hypothetical protein QNJ97_08945 [Myxococcota bacterium]|nr:hypothetical protein [Myxococcota bacterium]
MYCLLKNCLTIKSRKRSDFIWLGCCSIGVLMACVTCHNPPDKDELCSNWMCWTELENGQVESPEPGISPTMNAICSSGEEDEGPTVIVSNLAAKVTLDFDFDVSTPEFRVAEGLINVPLDLQNYFIGPPTMDIKRISNAVGDLTENEMSFELDALKKTSEGYSFHLEWSDSAAMIKTTVSFDIVCDDGSSKSVESATYLRWCHLDEYSDKESSEKGWVSSGGACFWCSYGVCQ